MFLYLGVELTNRCDIACLHCLRDKADERKDLEKDFFLRILKEARDLNVSLIAFTGGEPTLHPDFIRFVDEIVERGMFWNVVTNGHNTELFQEIFKEDKRKTANHLIAISLDGATQEVHDHIRGKGSFKKIMRTATLLKNLGVKVQLQMVLTSKNMEQMESFLVLASTLGAAKAYFITLQATKKALASGLMMTPDQYRRAQIRISELTKTFKIHVGQAFGYFHPNPMIKCAVLTSDALNMDYDGNLTFCCQLSNFGDITYVKDRQEIICDLKKVSLLEGYKKMQDRISAYNKEKAEHASCGKIKGLDLFPCFYCAKKFGKFDWFNDPDVMDDPVVKAWNEENRELNRPLVADSPYAPINPSNWPIF